MARPPPPPTTSTTRAPRAPPPHEPIASPPSADGAGWGVYVLLCGDGSLYTGVTTDLLRRLQQHETGRGARYTRARRPLRVVFWEPGHSRSSALQLEAAIKRLPRATKLVLAAGAPSSSPAPALDDPDG